MDLEWTAGPVEQARGERAPRPAEWVPVQRPTGLDGVAGADAVAYRTELPSVDGTQRALVVLEGLYAGGQAWLDGTPVGRSEASFDPIAITYDATESRELIVECRQSSKGVGPGSEPSPVPAPSIRRPVDIEPLPPVGIVDLTVQPRPTADPPTLEVTATVDAARRVEERLTVSVRPDGFRGHGTMERADVEAEPGSRRTVTTSVALPDAKLWWPRDLGPQPRYLVTARLGDHERRCTTGLCAVRRERAVLEVNGHRYRARGIAVGPDDDPEAVVDRAIDANATLVRAHAHVPSHELHRRCDEAGLLVWQDLPVSGSASIDAPVGRSLAETLGRRYGHHPSVALYGVLDDPVRPFDDRLENGRVGRARFRWRTWRTDLDRADPERIAAAFPDGSVSVPVAGQPGTEPDAAHLYPGWNYGRPGMLDWIADLSPDLLNAVGEFGAGSVADGASEPPAAVDESILRAVSNPGDPARTRTDQARIVGRTAEGIRRHGACVTVAYRLFDESEAGGFGVCTADGEPKPAYESLQRAFEPVQAVLTGPPDGTVDAVVCNDDPQRRECTVKWTAGSEAGSETVSVAAFDRASVGPIRIDDSADRVLLRVDVDGEWTVHNRYDR